MEKQNKITESLLGLTAINELISKEIYDSSIYISNSRKKELSTLLDAVKNLSSYITEELKEISKELNQTINN